MQTWFDDERDAPRQQKQPEGPFSPCAAMVTFGYLLFGLILVF